jgi:hypothetical protein
LLPGDHADARDPKMMVGNASLNGRVAAMSQEDKMTSPRKNMPLFAVLLHAVRCFNTAAFIALACYYFAAYCLNNAPAVQLPLTPLPLSSTTT